MFFFMLISFHLTKSGAAEAAPRKTRLHILLRHKTFLSAKMRSGDAFLPKLVETHLCEQKGI
jgi:hypothetical protein